MKSIEPASVGGGEFCLILLKKKEKKEKRNEKKRSIQFQPPTKKLTNYTQPRAKCSRCVCVCTESHRQTVAPLHTQINISVLLLMLLPVVFLITLAATVVKGGLSCSSFFSLPPTWNCNRPIHCSFLVLSFILFLFLTRSAFDFFKTPAPHWSICCRGRKRGRNHIRCKNWSASLRHLINVF